MSNQPSRLPLLHLPSLVHSEIFNMFDPTSAINCLVTSKRMSRVIMLHIQKPIRMTVTLSTFRLELTQYFSGEHHHHHWKFIKSTVESVTTEITEYVIADDDKSVTYTTTIHCANPEDSLKTWAELAIKVFRMSRAVSSCDIQFVT